MPSIHVNVAPHKKLTKHEKRREVHHATHHDHDDEQNNKKRPQHHANHIHGGTHPVKKSHHSGSHVTNPNVVHHHAITHSETATAANEKNKKKASIHNALGSVASGVLKGVTKPSTKTQPKSPKSTTKVTPRPTPKSTPHTSSRVPQSGSGVAANPGNISTPQQIAKAISDNASSSAAYNKAHAQHSGNSGGSVSSATSYDYSNSYTSPQNSNQPSLWDKIVSSVSSWLPKPTTSSDYWNPFNQ